MNSIKRVIGGKTYELTMDFEELTDEEKESINSIVKEHDLYGYVIVKQMHEEKPYLRLLELNRRLCINCLIHENDFSGIDYDVVYTPKYLEVDDDEERYNSHYDRKNEMENCLNELVRKIIIEL